MLTLPRSRTSPASATAGAAPTSAPPEALAAVWRLAGSLTLKLVVLVGIFALLPAVLYGEFEDADQDKRELVSSSVQRQGRLIAEALRPTLDSGQTPPLAELNSELSKYSDGDMSLKLMFRPRQGQAGQGFYYVASAPVRGPHELEAEWDQLSQLGVLPRLSDSCDSDVPQPIRQRNRADTEELLTAVVPVRTQSGCWALVTAHTTSQFLNTAIGRPYWQTREVRLAAYIYLALALLAVMTALSVRRSLRQFRQVAREIREGREGGVLFASRNTVPELDSVAADFDQLVQDLHGAARDIREAAEDNAHSFKTPLATVQACLDSLRRAVPEDNARAQRAFALIESSLGRLRVLVDAAQRLDTDTADLIEAPRRVVDLTQIVAEALLHCREIMAERDIRLSRHLDERVPVRASRGLLGVVIENLLDNAISFSPPGSTISVSLAADDATAELRIEDEGPGIASDKIAHIFDRYFSLRSAHQKLLIENQDESAPKHAGLGLWIVRRNVTAIGGSVAAVNRVEGGLSVRVILPLAD
jgi:two-component system sensor histidine kinase ChvG